MGRNARLTAERLYSDAYERRIVEFYTRARPALPAPDVVAT
jgi:hypothetical protein